LSGFIDVLSLSEVDLAIAAGAEALVLVGMELEKVFKSKKKPLVE